MYSHVKRVLDIFFAIISGIIFLPFGLIIAFLIKATSKGPIFFKQQRVGKDCKIFIIYKFRTMRQEAPKDIPTHLVQNPDQMITRVGRFLRKTSLDEIPQVFNILKGDMSFVGPRPALWNQDDLVAERDKYGANGILPGLTGLAQISGRDELPIPVKAKYDGEYTQKMSFFSDVKIIFKTSISVFVARGVKEGADLPGAEAKR